MAAALIGAAVAGGTALYSANQARKQAKNAQGAAQQAGQDYVAAVDRGINESQGAYDESLNYLAPYRDMGQRSAGLIEDIIGINGTDAQNNALSMYRSSPSSQLLGNVREEAIRRTMGSAAAGGLSNAGSTTQSLARRLSDIELANYQNWESLPKGMVGLGLQAAGQSASIGANRGNAILGARSGQGSALASAGIMGANAVNAGIGAQTNAFSNAAGKIGAMDWSQYFKPGAGAATGTGNNFNTRPWSEV